MKPVLLIVLAFLVNTSTNHTVDTYDWSVFELAFKHINEAISTTVDAQIIINDTYTLRVEDLPKKTKSQLAILNDGLYGAWISAESALGKEEANKYWGKRLDRERMESLNCYEDLEDAMTEVYSVMFQKIPECQAGRLTDCHLEYVQLAINEHMNYYQCIEQKFGDSTSPLKPLLGVSK